MAKRLTLCYCVYDPDNYMGHRMHILDATDLEAAEVEAEKFLNDLWVYGKFEYLIVETKTSHRLYDNKAQRRL